MKKTLLLLTLSLLLGAFIGAPAFAQKAPPAKQYKNSTAIPPGIESPDKVNTRLGTLTFSHGFPDKATVEKLYDNLDFQRAVQAYLLGLAPVSQLANRKGILEVGPVNTTVPIFETMMTARSIFLTPNNNTPYTWFWLDLRKGPLVVEVPPKVLGLLDDMWYRFVTDIGMVGPDKGAGGKYLILPPGYKGEVPEGYFVVRSATYSNWIAWRTFLENGDPKPGVDRVKQFTKIYPLSQAANPPKLNFVNVSGRDFNTVGPADYPFWEYLNQVVQEEPTESVDPVTLGLWASIGIQKGKPFNPDARMKKILTEAALVGDATARAIMYRWRTPEGYYYPDTKSAWRTGICRRLQVRRERRASSGWIRRILLLRHRRNTGHGFKGGRRRVAVYGGIRRLQRQPSRRRQELQASPASQYPGRQLLVGDPLRQPDPLDAPDRPAVAGCQQPDQGTPGQSGQFRGRLFRTEVPEGKGEQLGADYSRKGLEHASAPLRSAAAVV